MGKIRFKIEQIEKALKNTQMRLPDGIGKIAEGHFKTSFKLQRFNEYGSEKWPEVQRRIEGTEAYKRGNRSSRKRAILSGKTGFLKQGIFYKTFIDRIVIATRADLTYAKKQNEGDRRTPKRKFMGYSKLLDQKVIKYLNLQLSKPLK